MTSGRLRLRKAVTARLRLFRFILIQYRLLFGCEIRFRGFYLAVLLSIERSQNIADIESLLGKLPATPSECDILISTRLRNWQFGGISALIHFLFTWAAHFPNGRLITTIRNKHNATA